MNFKPIFSFFYKGVSIFVHCHYSVVCKSHAELLNCFPWNSENWVPVVLAWNSCLLWGTVPWSVSGCSLNICGWLIASFADHMATILLDCKVSTGKQSILVCNQPHCYVISHATWDHTVLAGTWQRWHSCQRIWSTFWSTLPFCIFKMHEICKTVVTIDR